MVFSHQFRRELGKHALCLEEFAFQCWVLNQDAYTYILGKHSTIELYSQPCGMIFFPGEVYKAPKKKSAISHRNVSVWLCCTIWGQRTHNFYQFSQGGKDLSHGASTAGLCEDMGCSHFSYLPVLSSVPCLP